MAARYVSRPTRSLSQMRSRSRPANGAWTWASWNPGSTRPPGACTRSVPGPASARTFASSPTAAIRPCRTARAEAQRPAERRARAPVMMRSGGSVRKVEHTFLFDDAPLRGKVERPAEQQVAQAGHGQTDEHAAVDAVHRRGGEAGERGGDDER